MTKYGPYVFGAVDKTSCSFSAHGKIGNFIIIIITKKLYDFWSDLMEFAATDRS